MQPANANVVESPAHTWFLNNLPEIRSRAKATVARLRPADPEEATAEILGSVFQAGVNAAGRGTLHRVTPFHAVVFATRRFRQGRRLAGTSTTDVTSEATQAKGRARIISLFSPVNTRTPHPNAEHAAPSLCEALADRHQRHDPYEQARQNLDYGWILKCEHVSRKARKLFKLLSQIRGRGHVNEIARRLKVSPGRVCQLKQQLAQALSRHGYRRPPI